MVTPQPKDLGKAETSARPWWAVFWPESAPGRIGAIVLYGAIALAFFWLKALVEHPPLDPPHPVPTPGPHPIPEPHPDPRPTPPQDPLENWMRSHTFNPTFTFEGTRTQLQNARSARDVVAILLPFIQAANAASDNEKSPDADAAMARLYSGLSLGPFTMRISKISPPPSIVSTNWVVIGLEPASAVSIEVSGGEELRQLQVGQTIAATGPLRGAGPNRLFLTASRIDK
jgi:hypothetical protein